MLNRFRASVGSEILFRRVGGAGGAVYENVIPGSVPVRLGLVRLIPLLVGQAFEIEIDNNTAVAVSFMPDELTPFEPWPAFGAGVRRKVPSKPDHGDDPSLVISILSTIDYLRFISSSVDGRGQFLIARRARWAEEALFLRFCSIIFQ